MLSIKRLDNWSIYYGKEVVMRELIDKAVVVAEIEGYISNYKDIVAKIRNDSTWADCVSMIDAKIDVLQHLLSFLNTLEVKDVQEESVSKNLEEAAFDYAEACKYDGGEKLDLEKVEPDGDNPF
jgi:hypothetical protein